MKSAVACAAVFMATSTSAGTCADWSGKTVCTSTGPQDEKVLSGQVIQEGMLGWESDSAFVNLRDIWQPVYQRPDTRIFFPGVDPASKRLIVTCSAACGKPCEIVLGVYHCPPCSSATNGGFTATLPVSGWQPGSCAPRFTHPNVPGVPGFQMVAFRYLAAPGERVLTPFTTRPLANSYVTVRQNAERCSDHTNQGHCRMANGECRWNMDSKECVSDWCPPPLPGMPPDCSTCAPTSS